MNKGEFQGARDNYPMALLAGVLGGSIGILVWWGVTVMTGYAIGFVAIVIGFTVGVGVAMFAGKEGTVGPRILSAAITTACFFYASYLVARSFINEEFASRGEEQMIPFLPSPDLFFNVVGAGFELMDLLFLGIALYTAWTIPGRRSEDKELDQ